MARLPAPPPRPARPLGHIGDNVPPDTPQVPGSWCATDTGCPTAPQGTGTHQAPSTTVPTRHQSEPGLTPLCVSSLPFPYSDRVVRGVVVGCRTVVHRRFTSAGHPFGLLVLGTPCVTLDDLGEDRRVVVGLPRR